MVTCNRINYVTPKRLSSTVLLASRATGERSDFSKRIQFGVDIPSLGKIEIYPPNRLKREDLP
jgi:hypothetical protein